MRFGTDKRRYFLAFLLMIISIGNACSQSRETKMKESQKHADKALDLRQRGDVGGAIQEQLKAIESNPDNHDLLINLSSFYLDSGNLEKAAETSEKAVRLIPNNAWGHYLYGETLNEQGKKDKALDEFKKAVELDSENTTFILNLGVLYGDLGQFKEEKEAYRKVVELDPQDVTAVYNLGIVAEREKDFDLAIKLFKRAIELEPQNQDRSARANEKIQKLEELKKNTKP